MKLLAACLALVLALVLPLPSLADPQPAAPPVFTNTDASKAIALVKQDSTAAKADPKHAPLTILDVRTPAEFAIGHLEGARNLDFHSAAFNADLAKLDKSKPYLVHCATGNRSSKVRDRMKSLGFTNITHLDGGLKAWTKAGGPVIQNDKSAPGAAPASATVDPKK